jgi:hypothetical protein
MTDLLPKINSDDTDDQDLERTVYSETPHLLEPKVDGAELRNDVINHFYSQIKKIPALMDQTASADQPLLRQLQSVQHSALQIIHTFHEQKEAIIKHYDFSLQPVAKEVLDELLCHAEKLKQQLSCHQDFSSAEEVDWEEYIQKWTEICEHWHSRKALADRILAVVSERAMHSIDKDIRVIQDYQNHQLANVNIEKNKRKTLQERLAQVTEEPLNQLVALRNQTHQHTSLIQAAAWLASFQEERESYFDQLLLKIDTAVRDIVDVADKEDVLSYSSEDEGEIVFMERELESILFAIDTVDGANKTDTLFIGCRLESLLDHLEGIDINAIPKRLQNRVSSIKEQIYHAFEDITST